MIPIDPQDMRMALNIKHSNEWETFKGLVNKEVEKYRKMAEDGRAKADSIMRHNGIIFGFKGAEKIIDRILEDIERNKQEEGSK